MTYRRAAQIFLIIAAIIITAAGIKALMDDNLTAAILAFWAVAWKGVHGLNQDQIQRLQAEIKAHAEITNLMAMHLTDEQHAEFTAQLKAVEAIKAAESGS
ncbi:hypothetical protein [Nonomuraea sp. JJY05]|uniref:hypothetical protein n=1 Tax=Nonomuraea sp. JJY05 TaxID=3350255 RepID=UPI00373EF284